MRLLGKPRFVADLCACRECNGAHLGRRSILYDIGTSPRVRRLVGVLCRALGKGAVGARNRIGRRRATHRIGVAPHRRGHAMDRRSRRQHVARRTKRPRTPIRRLSLRHIAPTTRRTHRKNRNANGAIPNRSAKRYDAIRTRIPPRHRSRTRQSQHRRHRQLRRRFHRRRLRTICDTRNRIVYRRPPKALRRYVASPRRRSRRTRRHRRFGLNARSYFRLSLA